MELSVPELKWNDSLATGSAINTELFVLLNGIANASGENGRIGNLINIKRIFINLNFDISTATITNNTFRILLFYDFQPTGITPSVSEILQSTATSKQAILSLNNLHNSYRFFLIFNHYITMVKGTETEKCLVKLPFDDVDLRVVYNGIGGTISSISNGSLYMLLLAENSDSNNLVDYHCRIRFSDC